MEEINFDQIEQALWLLVLLIPIALCACILKIRHISRVDRKLFELKMLAQHLTDPAGCENADSIYEQIKKICNRYKISLCNIGFQNYFLLCQEALAAMERYFRRADLAHNDIYAELRKLRDEPAEAKDPNLATANKKARERVDTYSRYLNDLSLKIRQFKKTHCQSA